MKKAVLFDLYDTVLKNESFDFVRGVAYVHEHYLSDICTFEEFKAYTDTFLPLYHQRHVDHREVHFVKDELPLWFSHFGKTMPTDVDNLEYAIMSAMQCGGILDDIRCVLEELQARGIPTYILSNTIFSVQATKRHLMYHGILPYFEEVYASAEFGVRKPSPRFFDAAITDIFRRLPNLRKEDLLFVGNDYVTDAHGGVAAGIDTVWYNVEGAANEDGLDIAIVKDFKKILALL
jgi:putative hydrolase of the HAD superfamily